MHINLLWFIPLMLYVGGGLFLLILFLTDALQYESEKMIGFWRSTGSICFVFFCGPGCLIYLSISIVLESIYKFLIAIFKV